MKLKTIAVVVLSMAGLGVLATIAGAQETQKNQKQQTQAATRSLEPVNPTFKIRDKMGPKPPSDPHDFTKKPEWIYYDFIKCEVNTFQACAVKVKITAPEGWQVCQKLFAVVTNVGITNSKVTPSDLYHNNNNYDEPKAIKSYTYLLEAQGNGVIFGGGKGANVTAKNVGLILISELATYEERFKAGCFIPTEEGSTVEKQQ